jgi:hypothetical protein
MPPASCLWALSRKVLRLQTPKSGTYPVQSTAVPLFPSLLPSDRTELSPRLHLDGPFHISVFLFISFAGRLGVAAPVPSQSRI